MLRDQSRQHTSTVMTAKQPSQNGRGVIATESQRKPSALELRCWHQAEGQPALPYARNVADGNLSLGCLLLLLFRRVLAAVHSIQRVETAPSWLHRHCAQSIERACFFGHTAGNTAPQTETTASRLYMASTSRRTKGEGVTTERGQPNSPKVRRYCCVGCCVGWCCVRSVKGTCRFAKQQKKGETHTVTRTYQGCGEPGTRPATDSSGLGGREPATGRSGRRSRKGLGATARRG